MDDRHGRPSARWPIPYAVSHAKLVGIIRAFCQRGATGPVGVAELSAAASISEGNLRRSMRFLVAAGIAEKAGPRSYVPTHLGISYAEARSGGDDEAIRTAARNIVERSHLQDIVDTVGERSGAITLEALCAAVKSQGRYPDGNGQGGMHEGDGTGAKALFGLLEDAGLAGGPAPVPPDPLNGPPAPAISGPAPGGRIPVAHEPRGCRPRGPGGDNHLAEVAVRGVGHVYVDDADTLRAAISLLERLRRKIAENGEAG